MSRRGEVPFVAIRVGRSQDPREVLGLAAELKISRAEALGYVTQWEEMILELGDGNTGKLPDGYTARHVAVKVGWPGKPQRLERALRNAGLLSSHRKRLMHAYWRTSVTGEYALKRAERREDDRLRKKAERDAARATAGEGAGDVPPESDRTSAGRPQDVHTESGHKESNNGAAQPPPLPPAHRAGGVGEERWRWLLNNHKRPRDARRCIPLLDAMPDEDWALVQFATALQGVPWPYKRSRKVRVLALDTHALIAKQAYLEFRPEWVEKLDREKRPSVERRAVPRPAPVEDSAERALQQQKAVKFVLELLADDTASEEEKEKARRRFVVAHPDIPPPWLSPS